MRLLFDDNDKARMYQRALKVQEGILTSAEQAEIESHRRVGYLLGVFWPKARLSLRRAGMDASRGDRD